MSSDNQYTQVVGKSYYKNPKDSNAKDPAQKPSYKFVADSAQEPSTRNEGLTMRERFGTIPIVTASIDLLLKFTGSNLFWLSKQNSDKFGNVVDWAKQIIEKEEINAIREELLDLVYESGFNKPLSTTSKCLRSEVRKGNDGKEFAYSGWFYGKNKVSNEVLNSNTITLAKAE